MALTIEKFIATQKANVDTLFSLTNTAFEGAEKMIQLNVATTKTALNEAADAAQSLLSVRDPQELLTVQANLVQPMAEKALAYSRHAFNIAQTTGAELSRTFETKMNDAQQAMSSFIETAAKNAPVGSDAALTLIRSFISTANSAFQSVQKVVKQSNEVFEANLNAMIGASEASANAVASMTSTAANTVANTATSMAHTAQSAAQSTADTAQSAAQGAQRKR